MPFLKIQTNHVVDSATGEALLAKASKLVAKKLGKPENYVMVQLQKEAPMLFAGTNAPLAFLELKSIGLPNNSTTADLSASLCTLIEQDLNIPKDRVYIEFSDAPRDMWGWNGGTF
jgi:phenylpyruvate tautomerase PptA (4-oxalocrotonate tautomerase family)